MRPDEDASQALLDAARSVLERETRRRGMDVDLDELKVVRTAALDFDGDGQAEICIVAGAPSRWGSATCLLLDPDVGPVEVVPFGEGFSDLQAADVDGDGLPELVVEWRLGSSAALTVGIFRWDGRELHGLLDARSINQGLREMKDLDGDGRDEQLIWESLWEDGANWSPHRYRVHIHSLLDARYVEHETLTTEHRYDPGRMVSRRVSLFGLPVDASTRETSPERHRRELADRIASGHLDADFVQAICAEGIRLLRERFLSDSVELFDLALDGAGHLPPGEQRDSVRLSAWWGRGVAMSMLGDAEAAMASYREALALRSGTIRPGDETLRPAVLVREFGAMCANAGYYDRALGAFATARSMLAALPPAVEVSDEQGRLESNLAITYLLLGAESQAAEHFLRAMAIDRSLNRPIGLAINTMGLGNVERAGGRLAEAAGTYREALEALKDPSDRDREADVHLELGMTLMLLGHHDEGLRHLRHALLLTSEDNLRQQGAKHYLYLAEGHRAVGRPEPAAAWFERVLAVTAGSEGADTRWQAFLGLALLARDDGRQDDSERHLHAALDAVERARPMHPPDTLPPSYLAHGRERPYEELVLLNLSMAESTQSADEETRRLAAAFDVVERARSRRYIQQLAASALRPAREIPPGLNAAETSLMARVADLEHRAQEGRGDSSALVESLAQARGQLDQIWDEMAAAGSRGAEYVSLRRGRPLTAAEVRDLLGDA